MRLFIGIALPENVRKVIADNAQELHKAIPGRYVSRITLARKARIDTETLKNWPVQASSRSR